MSIETPAKRPHNTDGPSRSQKRVTRKALTSEQRQSLRHAQYLENGIDVCEQLHRLKRGHADQQQIDWSPQNVVATASGISSSGIATAGGHVIVRYPAPESSKLWIRPSHLYPDQPTFSPTPSAGPSQPRTPAPDAQQRVRYGDPVHIAFSPCGYLLCAYFPALPSATANSSSLPSLPSDAQALQNGTDAANGQAAAAIPMISQLSGSVPLDATLPAPANPAAAAASTIASSDSGSEAMGRFCIWSRIETGALNDWKLADSIPVDATQRRGRAAAGKADNVLKVNDKGQQILKDTARASPSQNSDQIQLHGGVAKVTWLNRRRRIVLPSEPPSTSQYGSAPVERLASRGPTFVPSTTANEAETDTDVALVVFGQHGQVILLCSRRTDKDRRETDALGDNAKARTKFFTTVLQSHLHTPMLQPAPVTLDSSAGAERQEGTSAAYTSLFNAEADGDFGGEGGDEAHISHLAVGMPANEPVLLVASKRAGAAKALVDLTEVTIDLGGDTISMTTRPLQPVSLENVGSSENAAEAGLDVDPEALTVLTWAEMGGKETGGAVVKSDSLRLVACWSSLDVEDETAEKEPTAGLRSTVAVWDAHKAEAELSDAFGSLECRKAGQAPAWLDWQLRFVHATPLRDRLVTALVTDAPGLVAANSCLLTFMSPSPGRPALLSEQLTWLDLHTLQPSATAAISVPPHALLRSSRPTVSANGALVAAFALAHSGAAMVMWKLPWHQAPSSAQADKDKPAEDKDGATSRMAQLLALSCLRATDASDVRRAYKACAHGDEAKLLVDVADLLKITDSKRQDVLVKIEGATQKGPSHDTNSIPLHQALRLLQIRMAISSSTAASSSSEAVAGESVRLQRLVLELGLCFQLLRLARVTVQEPINPVKDEGKKKGAKPATNGAPAGETRTRVYYRLESVWPLLAQLQWLLGLLDGVSKLALATAAVDGSTHEAKAGEAGEAFEEEFVRMLSKQTPRKLVLQIVAHLCDFAEWLASTARRENLPPPTSGSARDALALLAGVEGGRMMAVSEQMALARESLAHITGDASVDLVDFAQLLARIEAEAGAAGPAGRSADRFWWATLGGAKLDTEGVKTEEEGVTTKLLGAIGDAESGALVDVLALFVAPTDVTDERSVLYEPSAHEADQQASPLVKALAAMSAKRSDGPRDIVRKTSLRSAVTQSAILNDAATLLRTHAARPTSEPHGVAGSTEARVEVLRAKRCVRCGAGSQDAVQATYLLPAPQQAGGMMIDPTLPPAVQMQMQMQVQMQMQMMQFQMQGSAPPLPFMPLIPPTPPSLIDVQVSPDRAAGAFRYKCLCGGGWWVL